MTNAAAVAAVLARYRFRFSNELELQRSIAAALTASGIAFLREYTLGGKGKIDFYVEASRLGIEIKIQGSPSAVARQVMNYVEHEAIAELLVVTSRGRSAVLPATMNGKPVTVHYVGWGGL